MQRLGDYEVLRPLGQGGMAVVHEVRHVETGGRYALKRLSPEGVADAMLRARFVREARALAKLDHPNVVRIHHADLDGSEPYIVQPLLSESLADRLREGPLAVEEARALARDLAAGLDHAHRKGVLHRDLKPDNVLLTAEGVPQIADFGLAFAHSDERLTKTGEVLGTPAYMAPEQARDARETDERTDVYALGAILFAMLSGRPPFESQGRGALALLYRIQEEPPPRLRSLRPEVPLELDELCRRALAKDPGARPSSAAAFAEALDAPPPSRLPRLVWLLPAAGLLLGSLLYATQEAEPPPPDRKPTIVERPKGEPERTVPTPLPARRTSGPPLQADPLLARPLDPTDDPDPLRPQASFVGERVYSWAPGQAIYSAPCVSPRRRSLEERLERPERLGLLRQTGELLIYGMSSVGEHRPEVRWFWRDHRGRLPNTEIVGLARRGDLVALAAFRPGAIVLLRIGPGGPRLVHTEPYPGVQAVAFLADGTLVTSSTDNERDDASTLTRWRLRSDTEWERLRHYEEASVSLNALAPHPRDPTLLAVGTGLGEVFETRFQGERLVRRPSYVSAEQKGVMTRMAHPSRSVRGLVWVHDGRGLVSVAHNKESRETACEIVLWDPLTRTPAATLSPPLTGRRIHRRVVASDDGSRVLVATDQEAYLVDVLRPTLEARIEEPRQVFRNGRRIIPGACLVGDHVLVWSDSNSLRRIPTAGGRDEVTAPFDLAESELPRRPGLLRRHRRTTYFTIRGDEESAPGVRWTTDDGRSGLLRLGSVQGIAFRGQRMAVSVEQRSAVHVFELDAAGAPSDQESTMLESSFPCEIAFSTDGRTLYGAGSRGSLQGPVGLLSRWSLGEAGWTTRSVLKLPVHPRSLAVHPDGHRLLVGGNGGVIEVDLESFRLLRTLLEGEIKVRDADYLQFGERIVALTVREEQGEVLVWNAAGELQRGHRLANIHPNRYTLTVSADQRRAVFTAGSRVFLLGSP